MKHTFSNCIRKAGFPLFIMMLLITAVSCSNSEDMLLSDRQIHESNLLSEEDAIAIADNLFNAIAEPSTRGSQAKSVSEVKLINAGSTRSADELPPMYLINYTDGQGYAIINADESNPVVYGFSDDGNLSQEDINEVEPLRDYLKTIALPTLPVTDPIVKKLYIVGFSHRVSPMLHENVRKWGQFYPFNKYTFVDGSDEKKAPVSCTALAAAQIMSFYKWPSEYKGHNYDWNEMIANRNSDGLAHLLKDLGNPENLEITYGATVSKAYFYKFSRTFSNFKYNIQENDKSLCRNVDLAIKILQPTSRGGYNSPLLMSSLYTDNQDNGHAWVVDGEITLFGAYSAIDPTNNPNIILNKFELPPYIHCVWGNEGKGNGYFLYDVNKGDYISGQQVKPPYTDPENSETSTQNFTCNNFWGIFYKETISNK